FDKFPEVQCLEIHLATEFQNIAFDSGSFPESLKQEMYAFLRKEMADERVEGETDEQFIYKTRKKAWGPFKRQVWDLPEQIRAEIGGRLQDKFEVLYEKLGVVDGRNLVAKCVQAVLVSCPPRPPALRLVSLLRRPGFSSAPGGGARRAASPD